MVPWMTEKTEYQFLFVVFNSIQYSFISTWFGPKMLYFLFPYKMKLSLNSSNEWLRTKNIHEKNLPNFPKKPCEIMKWVNFKAFFWIFFHFLKIKFGFIWKNIHNISWNWFIWFHEFFWTMSIFKTEMTLFFREISSFWLVYYY